MSHSPLTIFLFILLSAILYAVIIAPQLSLTMGRYDHLQALTMLISQGEELQQQRDALLAQKNTIPTWKRDLLESARAPYSSEEVVRFVLDLNVLLVQSSLGATTPYTVGAKQQSGGANAVVVPIAFSFSTIEYDQLRLFLDRLSQWDRGVRVRSVQISSSQTGTGSDTAVQASVTLEALFSDTVL